MCLGHVRVAVYGREITGCCRKDYVYLSHVQYIGGGMKISGKAGAYTCIGHGRRWPINNSTFFTGQGLSLTGRSEPLTPKRPIIM